MDWESIWWAQSLCPARIYMFLELLLERMPMFSMFGPIRMLGSPFVDVLLVDLPAVMGAADDFVLVCARRDGRLAKQGV